MYFRPSTRGPRRIAGLTALALVGTGLVVTALAASAPHPGTPAGPPVDLRAMTEQPDSRSATLVAERTGRRIEIADRRTPTGQVFALPGGTFEREETLSPQRARRADGSWGAIDTTLVAGAGDTLRPANSPLRTTLSGGGAVPLLSFADDAGHEISLSWPDALPPPTVTGSVATYADVLPGVDLQVRADADGPRSVFVVKDRAAAAHPALAALALTVRAKNVTVSVGATNNLVATDAAGKTIFITAPLLMWDAAAGAERFGEEPGAQWAPTTAGRSTEVGIRLDGDRLLLTPDRALLDDPATVYPVRIDPKWHSVGQNFWLLLNSADPNVPHWNGGSRNGDPEGDVATGRTLYNGSQFSIRSFLFFDSSWFAGKNILAAKLQMTMSYAWSWACSEPNYPLDVWNVSGLNGATTWNNQNVWNSVLISTNLTYGNGSINAQCPNDTDVSLDVTGKAQAVAAAGAGQIEFGLRSRTEACVNTSRGTECFGWRRFRDDGTAIDGGIPLRLTVQYNDAPNAPADLTIDGKPCNGGTVNVGAGAGYTVSAVLSDPNGEEIDGELRVTRPDSSVHAQRSGYVPSGGRATWVVNSAVFVDGQSHHVNAIAQDREPRWGTWATGCTVFADKTPPRPPAVASTDYPAGETQHGSVGKTGSFTVTSADSDVVTYRYGFTDPPTSTVAPATAGGPVSLSLTPPRDGPVTLYLQSVDRVGNASTVTRYLFGVRPGTDPVGHWKLDEGTGRTVADTAYPANPSDVARPATIGGETGWFSDQVDAKLGHETFARFTGTGSARTTQPVLDTTRAYTVSAWVRMPTTPAGNRTVVSQDGDRTSIFSLKYSAVPDRWQFVLSNGDVDNPTVSWARAAEPPRLNVWTHLAGVYDPMERRAYLYVDGALAGSTEVANAWNATGWLNIGRGKWNGSATDFWQGDIDDVRVYDRAVRPTEFIGFVKRVEGWWGFHDGNPSTVADRSGYGRTGTLSNGGITTGFDGHGATFNGSDSRATVAAPGIRTNGNFTVSAWVRLLADDRSQTAVSTLGTYGNSANLGYDLTSNRWAFKLPNSDSASSTAALTALSTEPPRPGDWTHLAGVYDATNKSARIWVNGVAQGSVAVASHWYGSGHLAIGSGGLIPGSWWYGDLDEVMAHTGALSGQEIGVLADTRRRVPAAQHLAADFTGDGRADTVVVHGYPNKVMKLWALTNSGGGSLQTPVEVWNSEQAPWEMPTGWQHDGAKWVAADFDGDGRSDIGVAIRDDRQTASGWSRNSEFWVFRSTGSGFDEPVQVWDSGSDGLWPLDRLKVDAGDVTGDGRADLVLHREEGTSEYRVFVLAAAVGGSLAAPVVWHHSPAGGSDPRRITQEVGDVDGDGRADLVNAHDNLQGTVTFAVHYATGSGFGGATVQWTSARADRYAMARVKMVVADATGDGRADVVHYHDGATRQLKVFASNGRAAFSAPATWLDTGTCAACAGAVGDWAGMSIAAGDLDGAGPDDLLALRTTPDSKVIRLYTLRSTGAGYETPVLRYTSGPDGM